MGLFDKLKDKKENNKNKIKTQNDTIVGFCTCGNFTDNKYCDVCSKFISNSNKMSMNEYNQILNNKIIIPLSKEYDVNFEEITLKDYFNINQTQTDHIIYRLMRGIVFEEIGGNIRDFFEKILEETKNIENVEETIIDNIKNDIIDEFYNEGYTYNILLTITSSGLKPVETSVIQNKHGAGAKILATALAGPLGFVATSGVKQTTETKNVYVEGEYAHNQYSFNPNSIVIKSYSDNRNFNSFEPKGTVDKIVINWKNIDYVDDEYSFILKSNDLIQAIPPSIIDISDKHIFDIVGTKDWQLNKQLHDKYINIYDKTSLLLIDLLNQYVDKINETPNNNTSNDDSVNSLEKIVQMYEKGLLTDEEFISMKQRIINEK